eukprot:Rhum_TRINITY_DN7927_c0_g2::Rhum_TRINITY_DN7927_c0_g2_i1::g.25231::m.25231
MRRLLLLACLGCVVAFSECLELLANVAVNIPCMGRYTNVKLGTDGLPLMVYNNENNGCVEATHCHDLMCTAHSSVHVDPTADANNARFIFMRQSPHTQHPVMSYSSADAKELRFVACKDAACAEYGQPSVLHNNGNLTSYSAFTFAPGGLPLVAYTVVSEGLYYQRCADAACSSFGVPVAIDVAPAEHGVGTPPSTGKYPSVALWNATLPMFVYYDQLSTCLSFALCTDGLDCRVVRKAVLDQEAGHDVGRYSYMVARPDMAGRAFAAMYVDETDGRLLYAYCEVDAAAAAPRCKKRVLDNVGSGAYGVFPEMDFHPSLSGGPVLTYYHSVQNDTGPGQLRICLCDTWTCEDPSVDVVASGTNGYGRDSSLAYNPATSLVYVSYLDYNGGSAKIPMIAVLQAH